MIPEGDVSHPGSSRVDLRPVGSVVLQPTFWLTFDVKSVDDLDGLGKEFLRSVPDPGFCVADDGGASAWQNRRRAVSRRTRWLNSERTTLARGMAALLMAAEQETKPWSRRAAFFIPTLGTPDGAEFDFPGLGGAIGLFAGASHYLRGAHRNPSSVHSQLQRGRQGGLVHGCGLLSIIAGHLSAQRFGVAFDLLGVYRNSGQFSEQHTTLFKAHPRSHHMRNTPGDRLMRWIPSERPRG